MKHIFYILIFTAPLFSTTLDEIISHALSNSTTIKVAKAESELAQLQAKVSKSSRFGELNLVGDATHYNIDRTLAPMTPNTIKSGKAITTSQEIYSGGVSYNVPLFTGFAQTRDIEISEIASKMSEIKQKLTKEQLIYNIRSLYLTILTQQEMKKAQHSYTLALKKLNKIIALEVVVGKKAEIDLIKSKVDLELAKTKEKILKTNINTTKATLSALADFEVSTIEKLDIKVSEPKYNLDELFAQNSTLAKVEVENMALQKANKLIAKSKSANLPQLNLNSYLGKNYGEDDKLDDWDDETLWQVGVNFRYNLLDFGKRDATVQKAKIGKLKATLKKEQTLLDLKKLLIQAVGKIEQSYAQYLGNNTAYKLSQKSESIEKVRYKSDVATLNDYLLAKGKTQLSLAKLIESKYEYQKHVYYLDYLLEKGEK
jgi:outer membrane protein TolC